MEEVLSSEDSPGTEGFLEVVALGARGQWESLFEISYLHGPPCSDLITTPSAEIHKTICDILWSLSCPLVPSLSTPCWAPNQSTRG